MKITYKKLIENWHGTIGRQQFAIFYAACMFFIIIALTIDYLFLGTFAAYAGDGLRFGDFGIATVVLSLILLGPSLAMMSKRLHDINKSEWYMLILLVPLVGMVFSLVLLFFKGTEGKNKYGETQDKWIEWGI